MRNSPVLGVLPITVLFAILPGVMCCDWLVATGYRRAQPGDWLEGMDGIRISDDPAELDLDRIHRWIAEQSYWGKGRAREKQEVAIAGSWNFGAYDEGTGEQVGFARVVTDRATFAWLCDVFVDDAARGRGVGKQLVAHITRELDAAGVRRTMLATSTAHGLYAQYGFEPLADPTLWMARKAPDLSAPS